MVYGILNYKINEKNFMIKSELKLQVVFNNELGESNRDVVEAITKEDFIHFLT